MNSEKGQNELARMLCNAVKEYVSHINRLSGNVVELVSEPVATTAVKSEVAEPTTEKVLSTTSAVVAAKSVEGYAIQVLASEKKINLNDGQFKSYRGKVKCYEGTGALKYKYCFGEYDSRAEAQSNLATLRRTFSGAFVVHYKDGKIVK